MQTPVTFILAFVFVLALIGLAAWLVRRFGGNRLGANSARGRMPRLAVIDAAAVDGRRRLVLVRRDNVEHLIMIGGPTDIVVEPNIVRAAAGREPVAQREAARGPSFADTPTWSPPEPVELVSEPEPAPEPAPARPARPSFVDEPRRPAAVLPERRPEPVIAPPAPVAAEPAPPPRPEPAPAPAPAPLREPARPARMEMPRSEPMMPRPLRADPPIRTMPPTRPLERANVTAAAAVAPKPEAPAVAPPVAAPPVSVTTPSTPAAISAADQNLADMAQRLEAALRRPSGEPTRAEAPEPRIGAPSVAPETPVLTPRARAPEISIASTGRAEAPPVAPPTKSGFENLEDEMASLLGRPKSSS